MEVARIWFDFKGRLNRGKYWFVTIANSLILIGAFLILLAQVAIGALSSSWALGVIAGIFIPLIISIFAVAVKRLHDRDKSAWWLLLFYVLPYLLGALGYQMQAGASMFIILVSYGISIWAFVELGCLRGTVGTNGYGPDPVPVMP